MQVLKFGGTSLGNADYILSVLKIVKTRSQDANIGVVLSAVAGVTNYLVSSISQSIDNSNINDLVQKFSLIHKDIIFGLAKEISDLPVEKLLEYLDNISAQYQALLHGIKLLKECPDKIYCQILSFGERLSAYIFHELLCCHGLKVRFIDSCDFIKTKGPLKEGLPIMHEIERRFTTLKDEPSHIILMSGFIGSDLEGNLSLLGRNGSDHSASLMSVGLKAEHCEIWTDVNGIYTADPNYIPEAKLIQEMSYEEAMELAFYGAKVLHPKTTLALAEYNIPLYIKNTFNPEISGTKIFRTPTKDEYLIRGISSLDNIAIIHIHGNEIKELPGIAARIFANVANCGASVLLIISQPSSENSICFCIEQKNVIVVQQSLQNELFLEIDANIIKEIEVISNQSIICIVEDQMPFRYEIAGTFFHSIAQAGINILAIAQGSSERCISIVIDSKDRARGLQAVHSAFFHTLQPIELYIFGLGAIGSELIEQIKIRQEELKAEGVEIKVLALANTQHMAYKKNGINLGTWQQVINDFSQPTDVNVLLDKIRVDKPLNGVFIDCTSSEELTLAYKEIFAANIHIITANKKGNSSNFDYYKTIRQKAAKYRRRFLYETNVGAGLPIIDTFQNLLKSGDKLIHFSGILSGSLSFIFGLLEEGIPFSQAVSIARSKGFTEPDPRDDLNGMDVARKVLILAREAGYVYELSDIEIIPLLPSNFDSTGDIETFISNLSAVNDYFTDMVNTAQANKTSLRFIGEISKDKCTVGIKPIDNSHPLNQIKGGENAFTFLTQRYSPIPLVITGYGAGSKVTAAGVFADILKTVNFSTMKNQH